MTSHPESAHPEDAGVSSVALNRAPEPALSAPDGRAFDAFVFDLDGTLLDTLPDLVALTNAALAECGYPARTHDEILGFVGSGVMALIRLAVPEGTPEADVQAVSERWKQLYPQFGYRLTQPYEGIPQTLAGLKAAGMKLAVLSNKFDAATREVVDSFLPGYFDAVHGESPDFPRKPDPTGLKKVLAELGTTAQRCVFVGDSSNDMRVAHAVGAFSVGVTWGYNSESTLRAERADVLAHRPERLLDLV